MGKEVNNERNRNQEIDSVKLIVSLAIVVLHYGAFGRKFGGGTELPLERFLNPVYEFGSLGVDFFFLVSGLFMTARYRKREKEVEYIQFICKRLRVLYPLAFVSTTWAIINEGIYRAISDSEGFVATPINSYTVLCNYLCINDSFVQSFDSFNGPQWYICEMLILYTLFYWVNRIGKKDDSFITLCIVLLMFGYSVYHLKLNLPFLWENNGRGCMEFFGGCLLFYLNGAVGKRKYIKYNSLVVGAIILMSCLYEPEIVFGDRGEELRLVWMIYIIPSLILLVMNTEILRTILRWKVFVTLSCLSTEIFFFHWCVLQTVVILSRLLCIKVDYGSLWLLTLILFISIFVAMVIHLVRKQIEGNYRFLDATHKM